MGTIGVDPLPGLVGMDDLSGNRQFAMTLARGLEVMRAFTPADESLSNRDLVARTGLPKATVSRLTYTLVMLGYLAHAGGQRYALGAGALSLAYPMLAAMRLRQVARPWLEQLAAETRCTVNLAIRDRLCVVYVQSCRIDDTNRHRPDIGNTMPLLASAAGRALILGSTPAEQAAILNRLRVDDPVRFAADSPAWERDRAAFAERGFTHSRGDWRPDVHAVAVPLRQSLHAGAVAVNCTLAVASGAVETLAERVAPRLIECARRIELADPGALA